MNQEPINEDPPLPLPDVDMQNAEEDDAPQGGTMECAVETIGHSSFTRDHEVNAAERTVTTRSLLHSVEPSLALQVQGSSNAGRRHPAIVANTDALDRYVAEVKELRLAREKADTASTAQ